MASGTSPQLESLRKRILDLGIEYFAEYERNQPTFKPGETYIPVTTKTLFPQDLTHVLDASLDLWFTEGRFATEFKKNLSPWFGKTLPAILVNSGSSANLVAISALGSPLLKKIGQSPLQPGDEILTAAAGFPTTVNPIIQNGWIPVFVDVDGKTLNVTLDALKAAKTPKTRAVVVAHTLGNPFRADLIAEWCKQEKLFLIEDCCDALGGKIGDKAVGSFGEFATVSFYPAHHITTGEGGAVMAKTAGLRRTAESIRDWGRDCWCEPGKDNTCNQRFDWKLGDLPQGYDHKYTYSQLGYNLKITDMQAALGLSQLKHIPGFVEARKRNWKALYDGVTASPVLNKFFEPVEATPGTDPSWFGFPLYTRNGLNRNAVVRLLEEMKIGTRLVFAGNLTKQPAYLGLNFKTDGSGLKNADRVMNDCFWLGVHPKITSKEVTYILESLEECTKKCL